MLSLEELCALPQAGRALLVMHRRLAMQQDGRATAFDLLAVAGNISGPLANLETTLEVIQADDERAHAMVLLLLSLLVLDRAEILAKIWGVPFLLPAAAAAEFDRLRKQARSEGGAS